MNRLSLITKVKIRGEDPKELKVLTRSPNLKLQNQEHQNLDTGVERNLFVTLVDRGVT
jgi:hypothetical protein